MKLLALLSVLMLSAAPAQAQAQGPGPAGPAGPRQGRQDRAAIQGRGQPLVDAGVTPVEIQRMFDAYALVQAQEQLQLSDDQYSRFLIRFKGLQNIRRQSLQEHSRIVAELRRLLTLRQTDETQLKERVQALQDVEERANADVKKAYEAIDQVLDVKQQATFRVFEEQMERRKLELVTRARQVNRPNPQQ